MRQPTYKQLIEAGYCTAYWGDTVTPKVEQAYEHLRQSDPDAFMELVRFDHQQGRRNWVYEQRTNTHIDPDSMADASLATKVEVLDNLDLPDNTVGHRVREIAGLFMDGYNQVDIAFILGCSQPYVSQLVSKYLKDQLAERIGE